MDGLSFKALCRECGTEFAVAGVEEGKPSGNFEYAKPYRCNGRDVYLSFLGCPACGALRVVQADTDQTLAMVQDSLMLFGSMKAANGKRKLLLSEQYKAKQKKLAQARRKLNKQLEGKTAIDSDGREVVVIVDAKPAM